jgi:hypothetical protein
MFSDAPQILDNPIPLQRKYLRLKDVPHMKEWRTEMCKMVKISEEKRQKSRADLHQLVEVTTIQSISGPDILARLLWRSCFLPYPFSSLHV